MHLSIVGLFLLKVIGLASSTCVLESEFGFILNCNFKKSGLFRVRNLGGLKAHFGLGFSLGDELGFPESLGNLEGNRRRALNYKTGFSNKVGVLSPRIDTTTTKAPQRNFVRHVNPMNNTMTEVMFLPLGVPTFRPIPKTGSNPVRRTDVFGGEDDNRMTNINLIPKYENSSSKNDNMSFFAAVNGLQNVTMTMDNKMKINDLSSSLNSLQGQDLSQVDFENNKHTTKVQQMKLNKKISGKDSKTTMVMNAPKEYYPSGYDKNFDDNFKSKVALPSTDFTCAEQKYFPGLYANIQLGCMVFHVCAITDDGMVMKSFLCPESTLFDQSILKCNWWFYVDCNNSSYDSNIPISKTYQLMKSLAYFSNFTSSASTGTVESKKL